jgi:hypothetical protein
MGTKWEAAKIGSKKHGERRTMKTEIYKLLCQDSYFPKDCSTFNEIVTSSRGDGYLSLHNILHNFPPKLTKTEIETVIPTQRIDQYFGSFIKEILDFI